MCSHTHTHTYIHVYNTLVQGHEEVYCLMATIEIACFHLPVSLLTGLYLMLCRVFSYVSTSYTGRVSS